MAEMKQQPRVLAINQLTGSLFRQLVEAICAAGVDVTLLSGFVETPRGYQPPYDRLTAVKLNRTSGLMRILTWTAFALKAFWVMIRRRRDLAFVVTNPPLTPWLAPLARRLFGVRYALLIYDVYPDALVVDGRVRRGGLIHRLLKRLSANALRQAECVFALSPRMREALLDHLPAGETVDIRVIPNWADPDFIKPLAKADNPFAVKHGLVDKFVVMYSGAFSSSHDLLSVVEAAKLLGDVDDLRFVLIGEGPQAPAIRKRIEQLQCTNVLLLPWQSVDTVPHSLTAADCHIVSIDAGRAGTIAPCKTYSALAAGAAIVAISPQDTELATVLSESKCGLRTAPRDPQALAATLRRLHDDPAQLATFRTNARAAAEQLYNPAVCTAQYLKVLGPLLGVGADADAGVSGAPS